MGKDKAVGGRVSESTYGAARSTAIMVVTVATKIEHIEEIADGRAVERHIGIIFMRDRIRQIVSAARSQRLEPPIALDEFQDRDMIVIGVRYVSAARERRDD